MQKLPLSSVLACSVVYPIDTVKVRTQDGSDPIPSAEEGGPLALYDGLILTWDANHRTLPFP